MREDKQRVACENISKAVLLGLNLVQAFLSWAAGSGSGVRPGTSSPPINLLLAGGFQGGNDPPWRYLRNNY